MKRAAVIAILAGAAPALADDSPAPTPRPEPPPATPTEPPTAQLPPPTPPVTPPTTPPTTPTTTPPVTPTTTPPTTPPVTPTTTPPTTATPPAAPPPTTPAELGKADKVVVKPAPPAKKSDDDDGVVRLSLPTEADRVAWRKSGFRLGLGVVYGRFEGLRGAPSGRLLGPSLRVGVRLDEDWSLLAAFQYAAATEDDGLRGLRFAGTVEPTWHATRNLSVAIGFGFGGIVEGRTSRMDPGPAEDTLESSYTYPDARTPLARCTGVGATGHVRVEWSYVIGSRTQTSVGLEVLGQWTACVDDTNRFEPDTGDAIVRRQFWPHAGAALTWGIAWR